MTDKTKNADLFNPGASLDAPPAGDTERQAISSLGGYTYQVAVATLAWIDLNETGRLYLEVAEDYATVAGQALNAVQVKDTAGSGSVTLTTSSVRDAIEAFVDLVARNRDREVRLRFLTTSPIGAERKLVDRPAGEAGLNYWRRAATGADVEPLRNFLKGGNFSPAVVAFVDARNNEQLRTDLLQRVHWDCGEPDLLAVRSELEERLIVFGRDKFGLGAIEAKRLGDILMYQVLKKSILKNSVERILTRVELYGTVDSATQLVVSRRTANDLLQLGPVLAAALTGGQPISASFSAIDLGWLVPSNELPTPRAIIPRQALVARIQGTLAATGQAILVGGSGLGKSLAAREIAAERRKGLTTVDLRDVTAEEARRRLNLALGRIGGSDSEGLIFDDFNHFEDGPARTSFARCAEALRRRDRVVLATSYRRPSQKALSELGLDPTSVIEIPYFTDVEVSEIVRVAGGEPETWGPIAYAAGAMGHPQLVHAFVLGMAARGWPSQEMQETVIRGFSSDDIEAERDAARRSMIAALSEDGRDLLYRLSLVLGRFDRTLALKIGALSPPLQHPGEMLDELIGPWIEGVGQNMFRVSPLAGNAGQGMLTAEQRQPVHELIAEEMLARGTIDASDANTILTHALTGKSATSLFALAHSVLTAGAKATELLAEHFFLLPLLRTDRPIFLENGPVSVLLRLAQFKLLAAKGESKQISACVSATLAEVANEQDQEIKEHLESMVLGSILNTIGIASHVENWTDLLRLFRRKTESSSILQDMKRNVDEFSAEMGGSFYGNLFSIGTAQISVKRLEGVIGDLDKMDAAERAIWLENYDRKPSDYSILVNGPWSTEHLRRDLNSAEAAQRYKLMAELAVKWGNRGLALQCFVARAVMFDEYMDDKSAAQASLHEAVKTLGEDLVLSRARARIFWRHNDHAEALKILRKIADEIGRDSPIDRAFALREAAISAAKTDDWAQAETWFGEAQKAASKVETEDMQAMSIGLLADQAVASLQIGKVEQALHGMATSLDALASLDPEASLRTAYCHRVIRHTVLWLETTIDQRETLIDGRPIAMLPGTCSNPEPLNSIRELPLGPLDVAWYMLSEAEISSGIDAGVLKSLRQKLKDGPILFMEVALRKRLLMRDIIKTHVAAFPRDFEGYLGGLAYLRAQDEEARKSFNPLSPPRGEIPPLSASARAEPVIEVSAVDAIIAFKLGALFGGIDDPTSTLDRTLASTLGEQFPGKSILESGRGSTKPLGPLDQAVADGLTLVRSGSHLEPRRMWEIALCFFEKIRQSGFRGALVPLLAAWLRGQWQRIVREESFRLSRPMQTVPVIEAELARETNDEGFVASLLLATSEAVGSPLGIEYMNSLRDLTHEVKAPKEPELGSDDDN